MALPVTDLIAPSSATRATPSSVPSEVSPAAFTDDDLKHAFDAREGASAADDEKDLSLEGLTKRKCEDRRRSGRDDLECGTPSTPASLAYEDPGRPAVDNENDSAPTIHLSKARRWILLAVFSCSQFLDIVSVSGALVALADIEASLGMEETTGTWIVNAYAIAFAGCLLLAGRVSDLYSPKIVFISGFVVLGIFAIACGVSTKPIMLLVFRGLQGAGGAFTIPSALNMIINIFPDKKEQASALAVFSSSGALGSVLGLILAGVLLLINWNIVFWIIGVIALPLSVLSVFLIPKAEKKSGKFAQLDVVGVGLLTAGLVALIYSLTTGSTTSAWSSPGVLAPMIASIVIFLPAFFYWETRVPATDALIPPSTWSLPNFAILFAVAMVVYGWFQSMFVPYSTLWQVEYGLNSVETSLRFLPCGITAGSITIHAAIYPSHYQPRYLLGPAMFLCATGSLLFCFASTEEKYFSFMLPGMIVGTVGGATAYVCCNIGMMQSGPKEFAGVLGAIFNSALQVGTSLIVSLITVLSSTVDKRSPAGSYAPYRASNYLMIGLMTVEGIAVVLLFREKKGGERREVRIH